MAAAKSKNGRAVVVAPKTKAPSKRGKAKVARGAAKARRGAKAKALPLVAWVNDPKPLVGIVMGSQSDMPTMLEAALILKQFGIPFEWKVVSAHRTPERLYEYGRTAAARGLKCIIAGAGGAAHLPGMMAALTVVPVFGVPVKSSTLSGVDSLYSIVQMPGGIPVGTLAIGTAGAKNAALLVAQCLGSWMPEVREKVERFRAKQSEGVSPVVMVEPAVYKAA